MPGLEYGLKATPSRFGPVLETPIRAQEQGILSLSKLERHGDWRMNLSDEEAAAIRRSGTSAALRHFHCHLPPRSA